MKSQPSFSAVEVKRLLRIAKAAGMPVEKMGLAVDGPKITLLPPANDSGSVALGSGGADWDARLAK